LSVIPLTIVVTTLADHALSNAAPAAQALERVPTRWNHLVEKNARKFNVLSMIFSQKWFPLLAFML
jgi:hypothetical protein